jgi:hypothetical protein
MNPAPYKWLAAGTAVVTLSFLAAFVASKFINDVPVILAAAGVSVLLVCLWDQFLFSSAGGHAFLRSFSTGVLRGGVAGTGCWIGIVLFVRLFVEVGDKFPLFAVFFLPFAAAFGAVLNGLTSTVCYGLRRRRT